MKLANLIASVNVGPSSIPEIVIAIALHRLKEITLLDKTLIPEALQSLKQVKKLRHPCSKALAQVRLLSYSPLFKFHIQVHLVLALHISCVFINICVGVY